MGLYFVRILNMHTVASSVTTASVLHWAINRPLTTDQSPSSAEANHCAIAASEDLPRSLFTLWQSRGHDGHVLAALGIVPCR